MREELLYRTVHIYVTTKKIYQFISLSRETEVEKKRGERREKLSTIFQNVYNATHWRVRTYLVHVQNITSTMY